MSRRDYPCCTPSSAASASAPENEIVVASLYNSATYWIQAPLHRRGHQCHDHRYAIPSRCSGAPV
jgi:hypothetical protein